MIDWTDYIVPAPHAAVSPHTLCEVCANACGGCCWSEYGVQRPVPGWSAVRNDINIFGGRSSLKIESYAVLDCPQFSLEDRCKEEYQAFDPEYIRRKLFKRMEQ